MIVVLYFAKVPPIKYIRRNKPLFLITSLPCMHFEKKKGATKTIGYAFGQTIILSLPLTRIRTLSKEPNLKMSIVLLVLLYIRYKRRLKSQIWDSKVHPWLMNHFVYTYALIIVSTSATTSATQLHLLVQLHMHLHSIFMEIAKCIFRSTIKCTFRCTPWLHYQVDYQL